MAGINLNGEVLTQHLFQHGQEIQRSQGGLTSEYQYDEQGRLTQHAQLQQHLQHKFHQGTRARIKQQRQYQYDAAGNLTQLNDSLKGDRQYHYDPLARLSHVRGNIDEHFQHDPAGHLLSQTLGKSSGAAPASAQVKHNRLAFQGDCHFEYDEFGNLEKEKRGKGQQLVTHYHYDCQHRLIKAERPMAPRPTINTTPLGGALKSRSQTKRNKPPPPSLFGKPTA